MENCITFPGVEPGAAASPVAIRIAAEIAYMIGADPRPYHADQIDYYLRCGIEVDMLYRAAESTTMAPYPSWAYFKAIIRNCARSDCFTAAAYDERIAAWRALGPFEARQRWARDMSLGRPISIQPRENII